jgi:hypothetical protein
MMGLNLRENVVADYWRTRDKRMQIILEWMEGMEEWRLDDDQDFSRSLLDLQPRLEKASRGGMLDISGDFLKVMAYMSASRAMRLMEWMDGKFDKSLSVEYVQVAQDYAAENATHQLMLDRLRALHSVSLLGKVFSPQRTQIITRLLIEQNEDPERF